MSEPLTRERFFTKVGGFVNGFLPQTLLLIIGVYLLAFFLVTPYFTLLRSVSELLWLLAIIAFCIFICAFTLAVVPIKQIQYFTLSRGYLLLIVCALFLLYRLPLFTKILEGEDTIFAELLAGSCTNPYYWCMGWYNGAPIKGLFLHPSFFMEALHQCFKPFEFFAPITQLPDMQVSIRVRFFCSLFLSASLLIYSGYFAPSFTEPKRRNLFLLLCVAIVAYRFGNDYSCFPHLDSTFGFLTTTILLLAISAYFNNPTLGVQRLIVGLSFLVFALGKQEWVILATGVLGLLAIVYAFEKRILLFISYSLAGLIAGSVISYLYDPVNYNGGFYLFTKMLGKHMPLAGGTGYEVRFSYQGHYVTMTNTFEGTPSAWLTLLLQKLNSMYFVAAGMVYFALRTNYSKLREKPEYVFSLLFTIVFFAAFYVSSWNLDRYFTLALIGFLFWAAYFIKIENLRVRDTVFMCVLCVVTWLLGTNYVASFVESSGNRLEQFNTLKQSAPQHNPSTVNTYIITCNKHSKNAVLSYYFAAHDSAQFIGTPKLKVTRIE